jgi:hypothetical protein
VARWADLVRGVAGHDLVDGRRVVEEAIGRVAHRIDHGELVIHLRELRQDLCEMMPRNFGWDGLEGTAHLIWHVFFWIPEVEMARPTLKVNHEHMLSLTPACTARSSRVGRSCLGAEHTIKREAHHGGTTHAQDITSGHAKVFVTKVFAEGTWDAEHKCVRLGMKNYKTRRLSASRDDCFTGYAQSFAFLPPPHD